ncbi:D-inositol-3-phosphate glycosyltransferase [Castellaniella denitrificans]|uniref:glycosyltransferase family 4 protein n=1 Tax=Castellaniella sp. TaxID=1955812 RepID=UPI003D12DF8D
MKIVINALSARLGGGQTYLKNLLAHLPDWPELEVLIYAPSSLDLPMDSRIHRKVTAWPTNNPLLRSIWERIFLPRILEQEMADVLFCPGGIILTKVPSSCKKVTMFRNMIPFDAKVLSHIPFGLDKIRNYFLRWSMLRSMATADLTIFISEYAKHVIEALIDTRSSVTIPHGVGEAFCTYDKKLSRPSWLPMGEYILYVSRFDVYKHQQEVVSAFVSLPQDLSHRFKLIMVGEVSEAESRRVLGLARGAGLEHQILITGPVKYVDLPALYRNATLNLFASSCENCPNILLEALGAGRPVLASNVMPMPEFGADAVEYFSPTDPETIAASMVRVLRNKSLMDGLADSAAQRSKSFSWISTSKATWSCIYKLIQ